MGGEANQVLWRGVQPVEGISGIWPSRNATRVNINGSVSGAAEVIVYTVPANKKLFLSSCGLYTRLAVDASTLARISVRDDEDVFKYIVIYHTYVVKGQIGTGLSFPVALEVEAGWDVTVKSYHASVDANAVFSGWLEDVIV